MAHPDLAAEQAYLDQAYDSLDRMREALMRTADAGATEVAAEAIEGWATGRLKTLAAASGLADAACSTSATRRSTAPSPTRPRRWTTSCSRNWSARATRACATSWRRSRLTST